MIFLEDFHIFVCSIKITLCMFSSLQLNYITAYAMFLPFSIIYFWHIGYKMSR